MSQLSRWLLPTLLAPALVFTLIGAAFVALARFVIPGIGLETLLGFIVAGLIQGLSFVVVDVVLLRTRTRVPPAGRRAWKHGLAAPFVLLVVWLGLEWIRQPANFLSFGGVVLLMVIVSLTMRLLLGATE